MSQAGSKKPPRSDGKPAPSPNLAAKLPPSGLQGRVIAAATRPRLPSSCAVLAWPWLRLGRILGPLGFKLASCWPPFGPTCGPMCPHLGSNFSSTHSPCEWPKMYVLLYVLALLLVCTFGSTPILGPSSLCLRSDLASCCLQVGSTWACNGTFFPSPSGYIVFILAPLSLHLRSDFASPCFHQAPSWTHNRLVLASSWRPLAPHCGPILDKSWPHFNPLLDFPSQYFPPT